MWGKQEAPQDQNKGPRRATAKPPRETKPNYKTTAQESVRLNGERETETLDVRRRQQTKG